MYRFIKERDTKNPHSVARVEISVQPDATLDELLEEFNGFIWASGYVLGDGRIGVIYDDEEEERNSADQQDQV